MLIKPIPSIHILAGLLVTAGLVACANPEGDQGHEQHHPGQSANAAGPGNAGESSSTGGMMGRGMTGASEGGPHTMDKDAMCAMYRGMRDAPSEQERQAMMERNMPGMSPEVRQQHMEMMQQQCQ